MLRKQFLAALIVALSTFGVSITANAAAILGAVIGGYAGLQLGLTDTHTGAGDFPGASGPVTTIDDDGFGGRLYGGYQFTENWAVELGWTLYADTDVTVGGTKTDMSQWAIDLVAKGIIPLSNGFSVYGKLGPAYVDSDRGGSLGSDEDEFTLAYGLGTSYAFSRNFEADLSWTRVHGQSVIGDADLFALGAIYHFS